MDKNIIVPYKYSFIGHFTSLYMLFPLYISYKKEVYSIYYSSLFLYITTNIFWFNVKEGFTKKLDFSAVLLFSFVTAYETYKKCNYFYIYWIISFLNICIFKYNKSANYSLIINSKDRKEIESIVYMELVAIHVLTLHIGQMMALYYVLLYI